MSLKCCQTLLSPQTHLKETTVNITIRSKTHKYEIATLTSPVSESYTFCNFKVSTHSVVFATHHTSNFIFLHENFQM